MEIEKCCWSWITNTRMDTSFLKDSTHSSANNTARVECRICVYLLEVPPIPFTHSKNHRNIYRRKACRSRPSHVAKRFTSHDNCFLRPRISITIVSSAWMAALTLSSLLASKAPESMSVMCYVFSQLFAQLQQWPVWYDYPSLTTITVPINEDESFTRESEESTQRKYLRSTQ